MTKKPKKLRNVVGPKVRVMRAKLGWSQQDFATKCQLQGWNVSRDIIARIELQIRWVADFELILLARALRLEPSELLPSRINLNEVAVANPTD